MPTIVDPNVLVGISTGDDAAVYRMSDDLALVQTVDFFPPVVDDPYQFGSVSAANALSDVYAMGAKPLIGLNIVAFPSDQPRSALNEILKGGADKAMESGMPIVGGHTIDDHEPKYGMAITGVVKPGEQWSNAGAQPGDALILTKPLGSGIITTAGKRGEAEDAVLQAAIQHMATLNAAASQAGREVDINACTDITGYAFLGHLRTMLEASGASARIYYAQVPQMAGAWDLATEREIFPSGMQRNRTYHDHGVTWDKGIHPLAHRILYDPQTSGGLLLSTPQAQAGRLMEALGRQGVGHAAVVGEIVADGRGNVHVVN